MQAFTLSALMQITLFGLTLAAGDQAATALGRKKGRNTGLITWMFLVFMPLLLLVALAPWKAMGAAITATALSFLFFYYARRPQFRVSA